MGKSRNAIKAKSIPFSIPPQSPICKLRTLMSRKPDINLVFDTEITDHEQPSQLAAHSCLLRLHSEILADALDVSSHSHADGSNRAGTSSSDGSQDASYHLRDLTLPGTAEEDFLKVLQFMYPITPVPKVTWQNLEALLVQGHKWNMPYILHLASDFIINNAATMCTTENSRKHVFKWLRLADAANLQEACMACSDRLISLDPKQCTSDQLEGLSPQTLRHMVTRLAGTCSDNLQNGRSIVLGTDSEEDDSDEDDSDEDDSDDDGSDESDEDETDSQD